MPSLQRPSLRSVRLVLLALCLAGACDRREEAVEGDLSPETGITTPTPQETPPSDPASGSGTSEPEADTGGETADDEREP